jgi:membrane protein implicated in regulation of membrane protease activity
VILLAHAGHWLVNAAYFAPVVGFLAWLGWTELRNRRERRGRGKDDGASTTRPASAADS